MDSRWNIGGPLSMSEIPPEYAGFVKEKRQQLLTNVLTSSAAGVVVANVVALIAGDASFVVLGETLKTQAPLFFLAAIGNINFNEKASS